MKYIIQGTKLVFRERKLWPYVWKPMLLSALVFLGILALGFVLIVPQLAALGERMNLERSAGFGLAVAAYAILWWFLAGVVYLGIAGVLSSFLWEKLSLEVEKMVHGDAPSHKHSTAMMLTDSVMRLMFSSFICCAGVCSIAFAPLSIVLAAWLGLYDYTAPAFLRRGVAFPQQTVQAFRCKGWFTFAAGCGVITLVPLLNVLMFPALVAGGTLMCADSNLNSISSLANTGEPP